MYDITKQAVAPTAPIHIKGADGNFLYVDGKPVQIVIYSPGSPQFLEIEERQTQRAVNIMNENDGKVALPPQARRRLEQAQDLADLTVSFDNLAYPPAGEKTGRDLFIALYSDPALGFIPTQITKAVKDWGKFAPGTAGK